MATGISAAGANTALDAIRTDTPFVQLHVGDPGAAGTANVATETTRKAVVFDAPSGGVMANSAPLQWVNIAGPGGVTPEDVTHFTIWNALSGGTFKFSGLVTATPFYAGNTYTIGVGDCVLTVNGAG